MLNNGREYRGTRVRQSLDQLEPLLHFGWVSILRRNSCYDGFDAITEDDVRTYSHRLIIPRVQSDGSGRFIDLMNEGPGELTSVAVELAAGCCIGGSILVGEGHVYARHCLQLSPKMAVPKVAAAWACMPGRTCW